MDDYARKQLLVVEVLTYSKRSALRDRLQAVALA